MTPRPVWIGGSRARVGVFHVRGEVALAVRIRYIPLVSHAQLVVSHKASKK